MTLFSTPSITFSGHAPSKRPLESKMRKTKIKFNNMTSFIWPSNYVIVLFKLCLDVENNKCIILCNHELFWSYRRAPSLPTINAVWIGLKFYKGETMNISRPWFYFFLFNKTMKVLIIGSIAFSGHARKKRTLELKMTKTVRYFFCLFVFVFVFVVVAFSKRTFFINAIPKFRELSFNKYYCRIKEYK